MKGYVVCVYKSITNEDKLKEYAVKARAAVEKYKGKVPKTFGQLEELPGVGHKTASVVMSQWYGFPAFPVDTHIHRLAARWGLSKAKNVEMTERDLKKIWPRKLWNKLHYKRKSNSY